MHSRMKYVIGALFFSLLLLANDATKIHAQTAKKNQPNVVELFNQAAAKYKREFINLAGSRGPVNPMILRDVSSESIARVLSIRSNHPYAYGAKYQDNTAVLFYSYEKGFLQAWLIDKRSIQGYHKQKISKQQINNAIENLRNSLGVDSLSSIRSPHRRGIKIIPTAINNKLPINRANAQITNILIPTGIKDKLASVKHLIVVPVLGIGTVPYAILQPFNDDSFLVDKMSISIAPSLFDLGLTRSSWNPKDAFSSPLIVGNPYLPKNKSWVVPALPEAEKEVFTVAKMMNAVPLIGKEATRKTVVSRAEKSSLLYFATHGVANSSNPLVGGFMMFSADRLEQGWWTAKQIQEAKLFRAQITVLSACQTGLGKVHDAGIIGLARAFQIAGVPRVVMSLWSVNDAATSELMQAFVKHLQNNIPAEALRKAMIETRKTHPAPSQWSSFVLFGTPR